MRFPHLKNRRQLHNASSGHWRRGFRPKLEQLEGRRVLATYFVEAGAAPGGTGAPNEPFALIQDAVDAAAAASGADTVIIREGTYSENLEISDDDGLTLDGQGQVNLDAADDSEDVIAIDGEGDVTLRNLTLTGGDRGIDARGGFVADYTLAHITIDGTDSDAVRVREAGNLTVAHSTLINSDADGMDIEDVGAISIVNSSVNGHSDSGIEIDRSGSVTLVNSSASGNGEEGMSIDNAPSVMIVGSNFESNGEDGLDVDDVGEIRITNIVSRSNGASGVQVEAGDNVLGSTIFLVSIVNSLIEDNDEYGIEIVENPGGNLVEQVSLTNVQLLNNDLGGLNISVSGAVRQQNVTVA